MAIFQGVAFKQAMSIAVRMGFVEAILQAVSVIQTVSSVKTVAVTLIAYVLKVWLVISTKTLLKLIFFLSVVTIRLT